MRKSVALIVVVFLAFCLSGGARAEGPAVSALNAKIEGEGGTVDWRGSGFSAGSVTFPLSGAFGAQFDAAAGVISDRWVGGGAVHFFWRDPDRGMIGGTVTRAASVPFDDVSARVFNSFGIEGEYFGPSWTVAARGGCQNGNMGHTGFARTDFRWYATDDLMLEAGIRGVGGDRFGRVDIEWQADRELAPSGLTLFARAGAGDGGYEHALAGIRFYIGPSKSLKRRHREDDPESQVVGDILTRTNGCGDGDDGDGSGAGTTDQGGGGGGEQ